MEKLVVKSASQEVENVIKALSKEGILENVILCVDSKENFAKRSSHVLSISIQDLCGYFRVVIDEERSFAVTEVIAKIYDISLPMLEQAARENTRAKINIMSLGGFLGSLDAVPTDIITSESMAYGAGVIALNSVFEGLCKKHNVDQCFILPSSIHEVLAVYSDEPAKEELDKIVNDVNASQVASSDQLSDHCYIYRVSTNTIEY